jgi:L-serine dehydratase
MEQISIFDMLKIGVGPSSSHTLGPWRAIQKWIEQLHEKDQFDLVKEVSVELYGSLSLTGIGHATDKALMLGLSGTDPEYIPVEDIDSIIDAISKENKLLFGGTKEIRFNPSEHILFRKEFLDFHSNGMIFRALLTDDTHVSETYFSIGGGFVVKENQEQEAAPLEHIAPLPFPIEKGKDLAAHCIRENKTIAEIVLENELTWRLLPDIHIKIDQIWETMLECMYIGCHTEGNLPGGLNVRRRAFDMHNKLQGDLAYDNPQEWLETIRQTEVKFRQILKWVSCFALSVNEVNASLGRVVTAPTNGSAGVIPSVLMYYLVIENHEAGFKEIKQFLLVAGEIGSIFKKGATISAAMGGCQAEIGVSSAMAAGALCELLGGNPEQVMVAAEIAMEHHLGLTCDPIGGLVQVPCIERNSMGAIKAINAAELALDTDPNNVKVPLDKVVDTMWETAKDMNNKYKETSEGGLAVRVNLADC